MASDFITQLRQGNFQAALDLGSEIDVDPDVVYKEQWRHGLQTRSHQLTMNDLDVLEQIRDDAWVTHECLETLTNNETVQARILDLGFNRCKKHSDPFVQRLCDADADTTAELSSVEQVWIQTRLYFLQYLDRIKTLEKIWPTMSSSTTFWEVYGQFRDAHLVPLAIQYARQENTLALDALFMHHGQDILPYRLFILSQIPETVDPNSYDLPHVAADREDIWHQSPWREQPDPAETLVQRGVISLPQSAEYKLFLERLTKSVDPTPSPAPAETIASWYLERAAAADKMGLSSQSLEILRYAREMGVKSLGLDIRSYEWLCKYVYSSSATTEALDTVTLDEFIALPPYNVLEGLLQDTDEKRIVDDMTRLAVPWLESHQKGQEEPDHMLYRWLLDHSHSHLDWCCAVVAQSRPTNPLEERIIKDDIDLCCIVLALIYLDDAKDMGLVEQLFESLPIFDDITVSSSSNVSILSMLESEPSPMELFEKLQTVDLATLANMMDVLELDLQCAVVLARYHTSVPLRWFLKEQSQETRRHLCIRMASQAAGGVESGGSQFTSNDDWRELFDDMERLYKKGLFGTMPQQDMIEIYFSSMLRCGAFSLAREMLTRSTPLLEPPVAERLVLDATREFFDNADTGNMYEGNMKRAMACLCVPPFKTPAIDKEIGLIRATHTLLSEFGIKDAGVEMMPIQVRQTKDKLSLVSKLINTRHTIYRQSEVVLNLVRQLGYADDMLADIKSLSMLAMAALDDEQYEASYQLCRLIFVRVQSTLPTQPHWEEICSIATQVCTTLGKVEACDDTRRLDVLGMALIISPPSLISDTLVWWRKLDKTRPDQSHLVHLSPPSSLSPGPEHGPGWSHLLEGATKLFRNETMGSPDQNRDQPRGLFGWLTQ